MTNIEYPRLCGGTFMTLVIQALLQRKKAREHYKGESDKLNDPDVLVGLITVINPDYEDPGKAVLKTKANDYKSCKLSKGQYLPFGDKLAIEVFDQRVRDSYLAARNDMCIFVDSFIETGTKLQKDVRLVKALIDLVEQDESIDDSVEFLIGENGDAVRKDQLRNLKRVCLPSFLLGIWHFIVINRKNNKVGQLTYDTWCPENGGGTREYEGYQVANEGDTVTMKLTIPEGFEVAGAYGDEGQEWPLSKDAGGNYYLSVPRGGGVMLSVKLSKKEDPKTDPKTEEEAAVAPAPVEAAIQTILENYK